MTTVKSTSDLSLSFIWGKGEGNRKMHTKSRKERDPFHQAEL